MISIGIIGGGIAGLSFANFLYKNNSFKIKIFEKKNIFQHNKSGIQLSSNAISILKTIDFNKISQEKFSIIKNIQIQDYKLKKMIANFSLDKLNNSSNYICLDRDVLINFLLHQINPRVEISHKEAVSMKDNLIQFSDNSHEFFDYVIVADGIFSKIRKNLQKQSFLQSVNAVAFKGIIHNSKKISKENLLLYMGDQKHFVFYPINATGDFSFTSVFALQNSDLKKEYENLVLNKENLISLSSDANKDILDIIESASDIYQWPIYKHTNIFFGEKKSFIIGDAAHGMVPFQAQGATQSIEDAFYLAKLFDQKIFQIDKFSKGRLKRVSMVNRRSNFNLYAYHMSNKYLKKIRNIFIKIICNNKLICNLFFGKIYNYKFKDLT